jgi:hypothetical protein
VDADEDVDVEDVNVEDVDVEDVDEDVDEDDEDVDNEEEPVDEGLGVGVGSTSAPDEVDPGGLQLSML